MGKKNPVCRSWSYKNKAIYLANGTIGFFNFQFNIVLYFFFFDQQCFTVKMTIVARMEEPVQMEFVHVLEILQEMIVLVIK